MACATLALAVVIADRALPPPIPDVTRDGATIVLARDNTPLRAFPSPEGVWRYPVTADAVSPLYLEALLAYEDRWFWTHPGVNPLSLLRAFGQAIRHGRVLSGGSTLTMQVARLVEPIPHDGLGKLRQIARALQLEVRLDKREILDLYLNLAPFGGTVQGVEAAAWAYLGKPALQLSHAEAALLAVLPQAPSRLRPDRHAGAAQRARDKVLLRLGERGVWSAGTIRTARVETVAVRRLRPPLSAALLAQRLHRELPDQRVIHTLVDPSLQRELEERVRAYVEPMPEQTSAAVIVLDNSDLSVRAYVGSAVFGDDTRLGHVDMVAAERSPGSTLKPFVYGLALEQGLIHSQSLLADVPQSFDGYRPANFGDTFNGPVAASDALRLSLNVPAVDLLARVGPERFASRLRNAGLQLRLPRGAAPNLSMALGGTATTLEELAGAYRALGSGGLGGTPRLLASQPLRQRRLLSAGSAWIVREILAAHVRPGDALLGLDLRQRPNLAWKTGTSFGFRDAWAMATTPEHTIGVWIGRPDGSPLPGHYGAVTALPLLFAIADGLPRTTRPLPRPPSVELARVCWPLGRRLEDTAPGDCLREFDAWLLDSVAPPTLPMYGDSMARSLADTRCIADDKPATRSASWPVHLDPWLVNSSRAALADRTNCADAPFEALVIEGLAQDADLRRAPGGAAPRIELRALGAAGQVTWLLDGVWVAHSSGNAAVVLSLPGFGPRELVAIDARGRFARLALRLSASEKA